MRASLRLSSLATCMLIGILALLSACSSSTATGGQTGGNTTPAATSAPTNPPATATPVPTCASLLPGASPASAGSNFTDVPFPANSVSTALTAHSSGAGQYTIQLFNACAPNTSAAQVKAFYAAQLPAAGWAQDPTLPFDGSFQKPCGDPYCWDKGAYLSARLVGLEAVTDAGNNNVTFTFRLFLPPPAGVCFAPDFTGPINGGPTTDFQFPPLTYYVDEPPGAGNHPAKFCSAGNLATILAFMKKQFPVNGWKITGSTATTLSIEKPTTPPSGFCYTIDMTFGPFASDPGEWSWDSHPPAATC